MNLWGWHTYTRSLVGGFETDKTLKDRHHSIREDVWFLPKLQGGHKEVTMSPSRTIRHPWALLPEAWANARQGLHLSLKFLYPRQSITGAAEMTPHNYNFS